MTDPRNWSIRVLPSDDNKLNENLEFPDISTAPHEMYIEVVNILQTKRYVEWSSGLNFVYILSYRYHDFCRTIVS